VCQVLSMFGDHTEFWSTALHIILSLGIAVYLMGCIVTPQSTLPTKELI